jgi:hypothetical protein
VCNNFGEQHENVCENELSCRIISPLGHTVRVKYFFGKKKGRKELGQPYIVVRRDRYFRHCVQSKKSVQKHCTYFLMYMLGLLEGVPLSSQKYHLCSFI